MTGGSADEGAEVAGLGVELVAGAGVDFPGEFDGGFPDGKVFEALVFYGAVSGGI